MMNRDFNSLKKLSKEALANMLLKEGWIGDKEEVLEHLSSEEMARLLCGESVGKIQRIQEVELPSERFERIKKEELIQEIERRRE